MLKLNMKDITLKRFLQPVYANTQATPVSVKLDPTDTTPFLPGYAMSLGGATITNGQQAYVGSDATVAVCTGADQVPFGLSAHFGDATITDEVRDSGTNMMAVWVGGNDAQFRALRGSDDVGAFTADADELSAAATALAAGEDVFLAPDNTGKLVFADENTAAAKKFIKLVDIVSDYEIIIRFA